MNLFDTAVVGAGPAGLTTVLYVIRDRKRVVLIEKATEGGQVLNTNAIANIPGFPQISGQDFIDKMIEQIQTLDPNGSYLTTAYNEVTNITQVELDGKKIFAIQTDGETYYAKTVVCATGATYRRLGVPGENALIGDGISFCSTCDAPFYKNQTVVVVGGGNSALTEAIELSRFARQVYIFQNLPALTASQDLIDKISSIDNIKVAFNIRVIGFDKSSDGSMIVYRSWDNGQDAFPADGVFIAIGMEPNNSYMSNIGTVNAGGYIENLCEGAFAAGDCKKITANQVVIACGSGAKAAIKACRYLNENYD